MNQIIATAPSADNRMTGSERRTGENASLEKRIEVTLLPIVLGCAGFVAGAYFVKANPELDGQIDTSDLRRPERIVVVGNTGSGKTTYAGELARLLSVRHIELDQLYWGPDWTSVPTATFRERVREAVSRENWVADGNYRKVRHIVWSRADTLLWLDFSYPLVFLRFLTRSIRRVVANEELFGGNHESIRDICSGESLFVWQFKTQ